MRSFPATTSYLVGNDLDLVKRVFTFLDIGGSVPYVYLVPGIGYVIMSQFGYCPMDSGVSVYFWTSGTEFCCLQTEDEQWNWDLSEEENIRNYSGRKFATLDELELYITTGE